MQIGEKTTVDHDNVLHAPLTFLLCQLHKAGNFARVQCVPGSDGNIRIEYR
jgi:hypothetical protein